MGSYLRERACTTMARDTRAPEVPGPGLAHTALRERFLQTQTAAFPLLLTRSVLCCSRLLEAPDHPSTETPMSWGCWPTARTCTLVSPGTSRPLPPVLPSSALPSPGSPALSHFLSAELCPYTLSPLPSPLHSGPHRLSLPGPSLCCVTKHVRSRPKLPPAQRAPRPEPPRPPQAACPSAQVRAVESDRGAGPGVRRPGLGPGSVPLWLDGLGQRS